MAACSYVFVVGVQYSLMWRYDKYTKVLICNKKVWNTNEERQNHKKYEKSWFCRKSGKVKKSRNLSKKHKKVVQNGNFPFLRGVAPCNEIWWILGVAELMGQSKKIGKTPKFHFFGFLGSFITGYKTVKKVFFRPFF